MHRTIIALVFAAVTNAALGLPAYALDGGMLQMIPRNGWRAFEVISQGNNPAGDGFSYAMPSTFDGVGAWMPTPSTLRLVINHETSDASISEVDLNLANFKAAISNVISSGNTGGVSFVKAAQQAYDRWSNDAGANWISTSNVSTTAFARFCSGQSYAANTFGIGRGFVDDIYMTGEEAAGGRLFAIDLANRDFYQVSGVSGSAGGGIGGFPFDAWENAALLDTGETNHVALLLSPDGGTQRMQLFIGEKGKNSAGAASESFLARNGLAYGSYYYLNDALPTSGMSLDGFLDTTTAGALTSTKLEDVDANPNDPTQVVLGDQDSGTFTFDFNLNFESGSFSAASSSFSITKILNHADDVDGAVGDADNVDWTYATLLNGVSYPDGLIFVNEDSGTGNGETWMSRPDGSGLTLVADNVGISTATESTGVLDISRIVGYRPGSVVVTTNQGTTSSLTVLINPAAAQLLDADFNADFTVGTADLAIWQDGFGSVGDATRFEGDTDADGDVDGADFLRWQQQDGATPATMTTEAVPEPGAVALGTFGMIALISRHSRRRR